MSKAIWRTILVIVGSIMVLYFGRIPDGNVLLAFFGTGLAVWGCYLRTQIRNISWKFMFVGLLAPIGLSFFFFYKSRKTHPDL